MVDYVTWAGMIAGSAVIFVALVIALRKNDFPTPSCREPP